jgi:DNA-binding MarR family transcriptional regulator
VSPLRDNNPGTFEAERAPRQWRDNVPSKPMSRLLRDATRAFLRSLQMRLMPRSVSLGHWPFLRILWENDAITQRELSARAGVMEPTTFSALQTMQRLGYITRRQVAGNKKKIFICLTPKGRLLRNQLVPLAEEVNDIALRGISAEDVAITRRTLLAIVENLARDESDTAARPRRAPAVRKLKSLAIAAMRGKRA